MTEAFIKLHISVLLAGFTGIFGKLVGLHELPLTWYRIVFAVMILFAFLKIEKKLRKVTFRNFLQLAGVGLFLGLHWVFFYGSIKAANISIGVVCFSLVGFFTAFLEPLINRHALHVKEIIFSLLTLVGIALIFHFDTQYRFGIILGVISSVFAALFTITNKKVGKATGYPTSTLLLYEIIGGAIGLTAILPFYLSMNTEISITPSFADLMWLLLLSSACTIVLYLLQIQALKKVSAFTVNLTNNLEPIYSIVIAMLFFNEAKELSGSFFMGLGLIFLSVVLQTVSVLYAHPKPVCE